MILTPNHSYFHRAAMLCVLSFFLLLLLYLSDCAASPTFIRFTILSFCLKLLHSHRALHVCSHDNLSSLSHRSSSLLTLLPSSPVLQENERTRGKASVASCLGFDSQGRADSFVIGSSARTGCLASDVMKTPSKISSELCLFAARTSGGDKYVAGADNFSLEEEVSRF